LEKIVAGFAPEENLSSRKGRSIERIIAAVASEFGLVDVDQGIGSQPGQLAVGQGEVKIS
jgi:hypothetical protein